MSKIAKNRGDSSFLSAKLDHESCGRAQIVNQTESEARVPPPADERIDGRNQDVYRRPMDVIRDFHAQPDAGETERDTDIGTDSDIERKRCFNGELVCGN